MHGYNVKFKLKEKTTQNKGMRREYRKGECDVDEQRRLEWKRR